MTHEVQTLNEGLAFASRNERLRLDVTELSRTDTACYILGAGGHGLVVAEAALAAGMQLLGFFDDDPSADLAGLANRTGALRDFPGRQESRFMLGIGDLQARQRILTASQAATTIVIHPAAIISPTAVLSPGVFVGPRAIVHARAQVGAHAIINSGAIVEHDCCVGDNSHIAPGAVLGGGVRVGAGTLIGLGARVLPGISVGDKCLVGCGAVVVRPVAAETCVVGVPARPRIRAVPSGFGELSAQLNKRAAA